MKLSPWEPDLRTVVDRIDADDIDLQPEFQRQEIWTLSKKKRLIDTIIRGWSIPAVFLVVVEDGRLEVLDGQQRLAAIRDFFHSAFSIDGGITPANATAQALDGKFYKSLPISDRRKIDQYTLRCFRITDYEPEEPSELFYRLNQPSMLTAGEQRNAFFGPAREQLKRLVEHFEHSGNLKHTIGFSNVRLAYDDIIARLLFFTELKTIAVKSTEAAISQRFKSRDAFSDEVYEIAFQSISYFSELRQATGFVRLNKASTLSWLLFFSRFRDKAPDRNFMTYFLDGAAHAKHGGRALEAFSLFQNRASLRVTDVSSVIYRDVALWLVYISNFRGEPPAGAPADEVHAIATRLAMSHSTLEEAIGEHVNQDKWGRLT